MAGREGVDAMRAVEQPGPRLQAGPAALIRAAVAAPFTVRARRDFLFCLIGVGFGAAVLTVVFGLVALPGAVGWGLAAVSNGQPKHPASPGFVIGGLSVAVLLLVLAAPVGRQLGRVHRILALRLLGEAVAAPAAIRSGGGPVVRFRAVLRDGGGWRALAYSLVKLPLSVPEGYAVFCFVAGLVNMSYPFWWRLFRNHPPQVRLDPVTVLTPVGSVPGQHFCRYVRGVLGGNDNGSGGSVDRPGSDRAGSSAHPCAVGPRPASAPGQRSGADPGPGR
jgi:hypothetical protein